MASKQATIKLYWCTTQDHDEDWFILAESARSAKRYHEYYEGYGAGDARARLIVRDVRLTKFTNGTPPCHAQLRELFALGFEDAGSVPNQRSVESIVELRREQMAAVMDRCLQLRKASYSATGTESAPGVETGLQRVG